MRHGRGWFVLADDFQSRDTVSYHRQCPGRPHEIRSRSAGCAVVLKRVTDNAVELRVTETSAALPGAGLARPMPPLEGRTVAPRGGP